MIHPVLCLLEDYLIQNHYSNLAFISQSLILQAKNKKKVVGIKNITGYGFYLFKNNPNFDNYRMLLSFSNVETKVDPILVEYFLYQKEDNLIKIFEIAENRFIQKMRSYFSHE